jgi:Bacterial mobilisation protein (MobC).
MKLKPSTLRNSRRKPDNPEENLMERITFRLTSAEKNQLVLKAKERGINLSLLCRLIVMRRRIPDRSTQTLQWYRALVDMKNNLNQIAHHLNTTKEPDQWAIEAIRFIASEIDKAKNTLTYSSHE